MHTRYTSVVMKNGGVVGRDPCTLASPHNYLSSPPQPADRPNFFSFLVFLPHLYVPFKSAGGLYPIRKNDSICNPACLRQQQQRHGAYIANVAVRLIPQGSVAEVKVRVTRGSVSRGRGSAGSCGLRGTCGFRGTCCFRGTCGFRGTCSSPRTRPT